MDTIKNLYIKKKKKTIITDNNPKLSRILALCINPKGMKHFNFNNWTNMQHACHQNKGYNLILNSIRS